MTAHRFGLAVSFILSLEGGGGGAGGGVSHNHNIHGILFGLDL